MSLIVPVFLTGLIMVVLRLLIKHIMARDYLKSVNSPRSYPVIGHGLIVKPDNQDFMDQVMGMAHLYPDKPRMVLFWLGPVPALMVYSAELFEKIVTNSHHLNKGFAYDLLWPWLGRSLLTRDAEEWRPRRKLLTPTFHYDILKDFLPIFNEQADILVHKIRAMPKGEKVEALSLVTLCTLDIICETSMGRSVNAQSDSGSEYVWAVHTINQLVQDRTKNPLIWNKFIYEAFGDGKKHQKCLDILHGFTKKVINERKAVLESTGWRLDGRLAFLDLLLEMAHNGQLHESDIQPEVDTFMFEGHDTTSTGVSWALHLIGNHPEVQRKIQEELDQVMGDCDDVALEDLAKLKYLECVIKESLRLYPSVPIVMRKLGADQELGGTVFPAGTHILLNQYMVHRDPAQWPEPEIFKPERFLPENCVGRHAFAYVPFSAGSRNCIGQRFALMEEKVLLAYLLRNFSVTSLQQRHEVRARLELIARPMDGLFVTFEPRVPRRRQSTY